MPRIITILLSALLLTACSPQYLVATNFNDSVYTGMTRTEFNVQWHRPALEGLRGNLEYNTEKFLIDGDNWEVITYSVYDINTVDSDSPKVSHSEYVAFRNGILEEAGKGEMPTYLAKKQAIH